MNLESATQSFFRKEWQEVEKLNGQSPISHILLDLFGWEKQYIAIFSKICSTACLYKQNRDSQPSVWSTTKDLHRAQRMPLGSYMNRSRETLLREGQIHTYLLSCAPWTVAKDDAWKIIHSSKAIGAANICHRSMRVSDLPLNSQWRRYWRGCIIDHALLRAPRKRELLNLRYIDEHIHLHNESWYDDTES